MGRKIFKSNENLKLFLPILYHRIPLKKFSKQFGTVKVDLFVNVYRLFIYTVVVVSDELIILKS